MTKTQLAENIIKSIEKNEWQQLQEGTLEVPVSEHNRTVLLELHQAGVDYTGEVCDKDVHKLSDAVYQFLKETWCSEPEAHKFVVLACLVLTFLKEEPICPKVYLVNFSIISKRWSKNKKMIIKRKIIF